MDGLEAFGSPHELVARIDIELRMLDEAVELVRRGVSDRVTLGGLRFGDQLLEHARSTGTPGVRVTALFGTDETSGTDVVVERPRRVDSAAGLPAR